MARTKFEMFSEERIALGKEVRNHPALVALLTQYRSDDWGGIIGEVAAYCNIMCDGVYMPSELDKLAGICYWKLKEMRVIVLN